MKIPFKISLLVLCVFLPFAFLAEWRRTNPDPSGWLGPDFSDQLGAENDWIARSIRAGRGFSGPFGNETGSTAWMPPALPYLTATIYWICSDNRDHVVHVVRVIQAVSLILSGIIVAMIAERIKLAPIGYLCIALVYAIDFPDLFQTTHDTWLLLLSYNTILLGGLWMESSPRPSYAVITWGLWGGLFALINPICGFVWGMTLAIRWFFRSSDLNGRKSAVFQIGIVALISITTVAPWVIRNRLQLGGWFPIKSNLGFELWQSQCLDDDGVMDSRSAQHHPWVHPGKLRQEYEDLGEERFLSKRWDEALDSINDTPSAFPSRVLKRMLAANVSYQPFRQDVTMTDASLIVKKILFPVPFLCLVVILASRKGQLTSLEWHVVSIYVFGIGPYVVISYFSRYSASLSTVKMLLVLLAIRSIYERLSSKSYLQFPKECIQLHRVNLVDSLKRFLMPPPKR